MVGMGKHSSRGGSPHEAEDAGLLPRRGGGLAVSMGARWKIDPVFPPGKRSRQHLVGTAQAAQSPQ